MESQKFLFVSVAVLCHDVNYQNASGIWHVLAKLLLIVVSFSNQVLLDANFRFEQAIPFEK